MLEKLYYVRSDNVSIMKGKNTNYIIIEIFDSFLYNYQKELKNIKGSDFVFESVDLLDYKLHSVRLKRGGSYIKFPKWLENKKAVINPKNENDDECLQWSIICALNYNEITKKEFESIFEKIKHEDKNFSSHKKDWKYFEQNNKSIALNILFSSKVSEEITLLYESKHNLEQENKVLLLIINDDYHEKYHYFAVKSKSELYSSEWLRSKKESITNEDNCFQNAFNDSLDYQKIKKKEDWKIFEQNNKEIALNVLFIPHNKKEIEIAYKSKYNYKRKK